MDQPVPPPAEVASPPRGLSPRAMKTRAAILEAAEGLFAERGFAVTRLEDVAEAVGIRRASIVYYYRDKTELYDAVLGDVFGALLDRIEPILRSDSPLAERTESAVSEWISFLVARPTTARLLLREVADAQPEKSLRLGPHTAPFFETVRDVLQAVSPGDARAVGERIDPVHVASTLAGATIFYVAAMPVLVPGFLPHEPRALAAHRHEMTLVTRRLLGLPD
ncbi:MAG: TetR/AcrR family transcriptional regulator [Myxococcota bacterium]|nr:TetR/AcrR family transcriptional regulator [Myxococcota bacterium]